MFVDGAERTRSGAVDDKRHHRAVLRQHQRLLWQHQRVLRQHQRLLREHRALLREHQPVLRQHQRVLDQRRSVHRIHERHAGDVLRLVLRRVLGCGRRQSLHAQSEPVCELFPDRRFLERRVGELEDRVLGLAERAIAERLSEPRQSFAGHDHQSGEYVLGPGGTARFERHGDEHRRRTSRQRRCHLHGRPDQCIELGLPDADRPGDVLPELLRPDDELLRHRPCRLVDGGHELESLRSPTARSAICCNFP